MLQRYVSRPELSARCGSQPSISANVCMNYKLNIKHKQTNRQRQYWVKLRHVQSPRWSRQSETRPTDCLLFQFVCSCSAWQWAWAQARTTRRTPWPGWRRTSPAPRVWRAEPRDPHYSLRCSVSGEDYPIFAFPPDTSFVCDGKIEGYYADPEADCQSFNMCVNFGEGDLTKYSLLCPNGEDLSHLESFVCQQSWYLQELCSTSSILSVTGGSTWTAPRPRISILSTRTWLPLLLPQPQPLRKEEQENPAMSSPPTPYLSNPSHPPPLSTDAPRRTDLVSVSKL